MPKTRFPDQATLLFGIGAQKAGSTWLFDMLCRSAQVHVSKEKELHYFDVISGRDPESIRRRVGNLQKLTARLNAQNGPKNRSLLERAGGLAELLQIYASAPGDHSRYFKYLLDGYEAQPVVCDFTPAYAILHQETFAQMADIGNAKFLFVMRDPVARMWSQIRMTVTMLGHDEGITYEDACVERADLLIDRDRLKTVERANYKLTMQRLEAAVPRDRIKYVFFEDLFEQSTVDDICAFAGIDPVAITPQTASNNGRRAPMPNRLRSAFRTAFDPQYVYVRKHLGDQAPSAWMP